MAKYIRRLRSFTSWPGFRGCSIFCALAPLQGKLIKKQIRRQRHDQIWGSPQDLPATRPFRCKFSPSTFKTTIRIILPASTGVSRLGISVFLCWRNGFNWFLGNEREGSWEGFYCGIVARHAGPCWRRAGGCRCRFQLCWQTRLLRHRRRRVRRPATTTPQPAVPAHNRRRRSMWTPTPVSTCRGRAGDSASDSGHR